MIENLNPNHTNATIVEQIMPVRFLPRGSTGLPEEHFQQLYVLVVDGIELSGCDDLDNLKFLIKEVYGIEGLEVTETVFTGFRHA